jgi:hypothetical protein
MGPILAAVSAFLDGQGLEHEVNEVGTALRFGFATAEQRWVCLAMVAEERGLLSFVGVLPYRVEAARRAAVAELLLRINWSLALGSFDLSYDTGEVRFRTAIDVTGAEISPALIRPVVQANLATTARLAAAIARVAAGDASPVEALAGAGSTSSPPRSS